MDFIEILKWVGIVLAAGFIGYFGRYLAMMIIERVRRKKSQEASIADSRQEKTPQVTPETVQLEKEKEKAKVEKKRAKAEAKRLKKENK
jgi:hypothetical protein